jgi:tripartite-type tricarboxylate transporter receptor subunit TctC
VKNLHELVALAKKRPGQVMYSTAGQGSAMHLAGALFAKLSGADLTQVPYKGSPEAVTAVLSGETTMMFPTIETVMPHIRSGRIRALAVSTARRTPTLPDVPTVMESGVKGYDVATWFGVFAPAKTPPAIVENLSAEIAKSLTVPSLRDKITVQGAQPVGSTSAEFQKHVREEIEKWTRIIREAKITIE